MIKTTAYSTIFFLLATCSAYAYSGDTALALPVRGITVDGDLGDWPKTARWYGIEKVVAGLQPDDGLDFTGSFAAGYSAAENALYIAVEVRDQSPVSDQDRWPQWDSQDGCQIYLQQHSGQPVVQYVAYGPFRQVFLQGAILDMAMRDEVQIAVAYAEGTYRYEWRIALEGVALAPGTLLGFGVSVNDVDQDGSYTWFGWARAIINHAALGLELKAALLLADSEPMAKVSGVVRWPDGQVAKRAQVTVRRADDLNWEVSVPTDAQGQYHIELPAGRYQIDGEEPFSLKLSSGDALAIPVELRYPQGTSVAVRLEHSTKIGAGFRRGLWNLLGAADGMPTQISDMVRDRAGYLWIVGSEVVRFDGKELMRLVRADGQPLPKVTAIVEDRQGQLWLGTRGYGLMRYDGERLSFFTCDDGLSADVVRDLALDAKGQLWVATEGGGLVSYDGQRFTHFSSVDGLACDVVQQIAIDAQNNLWAATWGGGLSRFDGSSFTTFTHADGLGHNIVESVYADRRGRVWSGSINRGLSVYENGHWRSLGAAEGLDLNWVRSIYEDGAGALWFSSTREGVVRYDGVRTWRFDKAGGLASDLITSMAEDAAGQLFFGSNEGGVSRYDGASAVPFISSANGTQGHAAYGLAEDADGHVWIGTRGGGAQRYDGHSVRYYGTEDGLKRLHVRAMMADRQGGIWFGYDKWGASRFDGERWQSWGQKEGIPLDDMMCLYEDRRGDIWMGLEKGGVLRYDGAKFHRFTIDDGLASNGVDAIAEDATGRLLLATSPVTVYEDGRFSIFRTSTGQQIEGARALYRDRDGRMWFGTSNGALYDDGRELVRYTTADGLLNEQILAITQDQRGRLFFGTHGGVSIFDGQTFQHLTVNDGLPHNIVLQLMEDRRGDMWIGTLGGALRYRSRMGSPSVVVDEVVADRRYRSDEAIAFSTIQDIVTFHIGTVGAGPDASMLYRYRLHGLEKEWQTTREPLVEYRDLSSGEYAFEVVAVDRDLNYSPPLSVALEVHLPYERYAWGTALALALALVAAQGVRLLRHNKVLAEANVRLQEADQLKSDFVSNVSHELRTPLTVIKSSVDNMLDGITGPLNKEQGFYLDRLRVHANRLTRLINDLLDLSRIEAGHLQLRPTRISLAHIARSVVEHLQVLAAEEKVKLTYQERDGEHESMADSDRIYQVLINLVNNALKFTPEGGRVEVVVESADDQVLISVHDTGAGIAEEELQRIFEKFHQVDFRGQRGAGIGLSIARHLVELHEGRIWAESEEGKGSTFAFTLPAKV